MLLPILKDFGPSEPLNLLKSCPKIAHELSSTYSSIKTIIAIAIDTDAVVPSTSATLEWLKSVGGKDLPTNFQEMELDCELFKPSCSPPQYTTSSLHSCKPYTIHLCDRGRRNRRCANPLQTLVIIIMISRAKQSPDRKRANTIPSSRVPRRVVTLA